MKSLAFLAGRLSQAEQKTQLALEIGKIHECVQNFCYELITYLTDLCSDPEISFACIDEQGSDNYSKNFRIVYKKASLMEVEDLLIFSVVLSTYSKKVPKEYKITTHLQHSYFSDNACYDGINLDSNERSTLASNIRSDLNTNSNFHGIFYYEAGEIKRKEKS